ncbi:prenyltransferase/squalene oxidase repeat-containing protein [Umezawaea sp. Da 62-37]|uniref:prenyltransferase/squalene oxidase repeat-containing protein n=1 Tax=Umezawaea sp. Da 62-37 TaxID=3075927 RepID=UPI0028F6C115|nr:prenyltransferase/squalene oxidase repeat-containing protein [Umezawaea sp. Da 62-37]WNV88039.1 prenyltransferase/squalene oxidase repeat-containing protein [Umezawaea sp. Da 62-37]
MRRRVVTVALLCAVSLFVPTTTASATHDRADAAAGWLARQLVDGERVEVDFGGVKYPDQGATVDAVFAFAAARASDDFADRAIAWLAKPEITAGYLGSDGEAYAGAHAKLLLAAEVTGKDPATFGGVDLATGLRGLLTPSGRFSDRSAFGDYSNAFTQSLALLALDRTSAGAPASAVDFLVGTQCPDGGFPLSFGVMPCASDIDATALVTQALRANGKNLDAREGLTWLVGVQAANGGFGVGTSAPNANSTGLAAQALWSGGRLLAAVKAKSFLRTLQVGCAGPVADRGAIAYDATGFDPLTAGRSTAQGVLGLAGVGLANLHSGGQHAAPVLTCP